MQGKEDGGEGTPGEGGEIPDAMIEVTNTAAKVFMDTRIR